MAVHSRILARKSHGQRSLMGYSPWSLKMSDRTEQLKNNIIRLVLGNYESSLRPDAGGERQNYVQATVILMLTFTKSGRVRAWPGYGTFSCEALQGSGRVLMELALCFMVSPMSHLRPGHTPTCTHPDRCPYTQQPDTQVP